MASPAPKRRILIVEDRADTAGPAPMPPDDHAGDTPGDRTSAGGRAK